MVVGDQNLDPQLLQVLTPRLLLRPLQMRDFEDWAAYMSEIAASKPAPAGRGPPEGGPTPRRYL